MSLGRLTFNYYTVAHKCDKRQLFAIPASYENNIALVKPEGRDAHARPDPLFQQPFSSLALYHCAAKFFHLLTLSPVIRGLSVCECVCMCVCVFECAYI